MSKHYLEHIPSFEELPPLPPEYEFIYCRDPLALTDEEVATLFPREAWHELFPTSTKAPLSIQHQPNPDPRPISEMQPQ